MKRILLTGLSILFAAVIGACLIDAALESAAFAEPRSPRRHSAPTPFGPFTPGKQKNPFAAKVVPRIVYESIPIENSEADKRSIQFASLMQQKAERMSDEELDQAIKDVKAELDAQNKAADAELQQAIDILEQLVEQSPGTPAAERARLALSVLKRQIPMYDSNDAAAVENHAPAYPQPVELPPVPTD